MGILLFVLVYSRLVNLTWGFPYLMHPDENNMMGSVMQLTCSPLALLDCLNPRFFAYGQFMLYLGSVLANLIKLVTLSPVQSPLFVSFALRLISAFCSILAGIVLFRLIRKKTKVRWAAYLGLALYVFTPAFIQQAHFGTTESLLTLLFLLTLSIENNLLFQGILVGMAAAAKPSGILFAIIPLLTLLVYLKKTKNIWHFFMRGLLVSLTIVLTTVLLSPHYLINFRYFWGTFNYESSVARGTTPVFYTQQFKNTVPLLFQLQKILPFALGWVVTMFGFVGLVYAVRKHTVYALVFLLLFGYSALLYAKWTRFIIPYTPLLIVFAVTLVVAIEKSLRSSKWKTLWHGVIIVCVLYQVVIGSAFLSVYTSPDSRFRATDWIMKNIPKQTSILSESANVVDIPLGYQGNYQYYNPFLNDLDISPVLRSLVNKAFATSEYVMVPSRRVFANYTCYRDIIYAPASSSTFSGKYQSLVRKDAACLNSKPEFPLLQDYYDKLFDSKGEFELVAEFSSFPRLQAFGITFLEFPDEGAEETWTVFDHPVVRLYKRVSQKQ